MIQKNIRYILIVAIIIIGAVFFILNKNQNGSVNWIENYHEDSKQPYGTYIVFEMMKSHFESYEFNVIESKLSENEALQKNRNTNYIFIGRRMYLDSLGAATMLNYVKKGNNAFISANELPYQIMDELISSSNACAYSWDVTDYFKDSSATLNFLHPELKQTEGTPYKFIRNSKASDYSWNFFDSELFCNEEFVKDRASFVELGIIENESSVNYVKIKYGRGSFFLHTTPLAFTNLHMKEYYGLDYYNKVFAYLTEGDIYWDNYNHISSASSKRNNKDDLMYEPVSLSENSPLEYILSQESLRWAWYLLLSTCLLFLFFRAKRRQRIIPVQEPNVNSSLEFVESIGRLYFQQNNHLKLEKQKMKLFLWFIREKYKISVNNIDEKFINDLSIISGISREKVKGIFALYEGHSNKISIYDEQLIHFHQSMDYFYKNCK